MHTYSARLDAWLRAVATLLTHPVNDAINDAVNDAVNDPVAVPGGGPTGATNRPVPLGRLGAR